jgi:hypothetical protein
MSVRIPRPQSPNHTHDSREAKAVEPAVSRNGAVQVKDMAEISMSLRQISDILDCRTIPKSLTKIEADDHDLWVDEDYLYMDVTYSVCDELMMDVCVNRGRAFIRVAKIGLPKA